MQLLCSERGFAQLMHESYCDDSPVRLAQESSAINVHQDGAMDNPGSSFLWIGEHHHLDRAEVQQLICHLQHWVNYGTLQLPDVRTKGVS